MPSEFDESDQRGNLEKLLTAARREVGGDSTLDAVDLSRFRSFQESQRLVPAFRRQPRGDEEIELEIRTLHDAVVLSLGKLHIVSTHLNKHYRKCQARVS